MGDTHRGCELSHVHSQVTAKHENISQAYSHGRVDIIGNIFIADNIIATICIKHVDIRYKYVNEYVEDDIIKIVILKSGKNGSNISPKIKVEICMRNTQ